jgi:hypothetical protein
MHSASTEPSDLPRVPRADRRIAQRVARRLSYYAMRPADIDHRLAQIDREWPVDRMLQANAATLSLAGLLLGAFVDRRMLWVPVAAAGFLLQHALRGWCPPLPLLRAMGGRTAEEISLERFALKALRGDFRAVPQAGTWQPALEADIGGEAEPGTPAAAAMRDRAALAMAAARR